MPELPEVETVKRGLVELLPGRQISGVDYDTPKSFPNAPDDVRQFLVGAKVLDVRRRAKVLIIELSTNYSLVIHLKMTGQLVYIRKLESPVHSPQSPGRTSNYQLATSDCAPEERFGAGHPNHSLIGELPDKSTRVVLHFASEDRASASGLDTRKRRGTQGGVQAVLRVSAGATDTVDGQKRWQSFGLGPKAGQRDASLYFNDQRKFGWMRLIPTPEVPNIDFMRSVGPEPLAEDFTAKDFVLRMRRRPKSNVKSVLLDQSIIAGVGNIYADESLWGAKIHPLKPVHKISDRLFYVLFSELRYVLELAIEKGGSSDKNYVDAKGKRGSYLSFARVFRREGKLCPRCNTEIIKMRAAGRGTHICPTCQLFTKQVK